MSRAFTLVEVVISMAILSVGLSTMASSMVSLNKADKVVQENRRAVEVAQKLLERIQAEPWSKLGQSPATWHRREVETPGLKYVDQLLSIPEDDFMHRPLTDQPTNVSLYRYLQYGDVNLMHVSNMASETPPADLSIQDFKRDKFNLPFVKNNQRAEFNGIDDTSASPSGSIPAEIVSAYDTSDRYNWLQFLGVTDRHSGLTNLRVYVEYYNMDTMIGVLNRDDFEAALALPKNQLVQSHALLDLEDLDDLDAESVIIRITVLWDRFNGGEGRHVLSLARRQ